MVFINRHIATEDGGSLVKMAEKKENEKDNGAAQIAKELLESRTIIISEPITSKLAKSVIAQAVVLNNRSKKEQITVYINSPGGDADSGFCIYDMLKFIEAPVVTVATGICASAAVPIFLSADKGKNFAHANARFLLHQPATGIRGDASDIMITAEEIEKTRTRYNQIIAEATGKSVDSITKDADRDFWMSAEEAVKYKLAKKVVENLKEIKK